MTICDQGLSEIGTYGIHSPTMSETPHNDIFLKICGTNEFQRLKSIKQLGILSKLYPNLNHSRSDHSIGVYKRAEWLLDILERNSGIEIDDFHKLCVKIAGLLHDIGHGPLSHFWERVLKHVENEKEFVHEEIGALIVDKIFNQVQLSNDTFKHVYGVELIKRLIVGDKENFEWKFGKKEEFIFDIINNKSSAIDVDRLDYLHRDWKRCRNQIDIPDMDVEQHLKNVDMLFEGARISPNGECIQFNAEHISYINSMFELREAFHKFIYQCKEALILEDILLNLIKCRSDEENTRTSFLTFENKQKYVDKIMCQKSINDKTVESWLYDSSDSELQSKLQAFVDFSGTIATSTVDKPDYEAVKIKYNYSLKPSIVDCLYGNGPRVNLKMNYYFEDNVFYKFRSKCSNTSS